MIWQNVLVGLVWGMPVWFGWDQPQVEVTLAPSRVQVAEPLVATVTVLVPATQRVQFPEAEKIDSDLMITPLSLQEDLPSNDDPGIRVWKKIYSVESFRSGAMSFPELKIKLISAASDTADELIRTEPVEFLVDSEFGSSAENEKQLREIQPVVEVLPTESSSRGYLGLVVWLLLAGTGIVVLGAIWLRSRQRQSTLDRAIRRLDGISVSEENSNANRSEAIGEHVFQELETTLREYLELESGFLPAGMNRSQLLQAVTNWIPDAPTNDRQGLVESLSELLSRSDKARFARQPQTAESLRQAIDDAKAWLISASKLANASQEAASGTSQSMSSETTTTQREVS